MPGRTATTARAPSARWTVKADTTPPVLKTPGNETVEADGPGGTRVTFEVTATDGDSPLPASAISCSPGSGSTFPLGSTTVQCTATDTSGNTGKESFTVTVRDTTPPVINAPDVSVTATRTAGIRRTDAALAAYLTGVTATDQVSTPTVTNDAPELLPVGRTEITFRARDAAGNTSSKQATVTVLRVGRFARPADLTPPAMVSGARAVAGDHLVRLTWLVPRRDFHHVTVTRTAIGKRARAQVVYRGPGRRHVDRRLSNGVLYRYVIVAFDRAGNRSRSVVVTAKPTAVLLAAPRAGQRVTAPPLLRWAPVRASYFNVQVWRGNRKLLSAWPDAARYRLSRSWTYEGSVQRLVPGVYTWYVWPGIGSRAAARYGPMLGKSTFIVLAPQ